MNKRQNKVNINILTFILIFYMLFILINDYFCFIFKENCNFIFYIVSFVICLILTFLIRKKINFIKPDFNKLDFIIIFILFWVFWSRVAIPDSAFDTLNYHLYLQNRPFSNNVSYNFFPARWINTFSFPLADRMNFFVRYLFGYRLGTMLDIFILIVVYYQVKLILSKFIDNKSYVAIISSIILITEQILSNMIVYYVDLVSIPLILEIIIIITSKDKKNNYHNYFLLLLAGMLCSLKISNAFFVLPLAIIYLIKNYKIINYKTIIFGILIFLLPIFVYALNNYLQTGNPVFPFYNSAFKSKYFANFNWVEKYYGPKSIMERIFWPIYIMWFPRRAHDAGIYYNRISYGFILALLVLVYIIYKKLKKKELDEFDKLCLFYIVCSFIWSNFVLGYIRYALFLEIISGIIIAILFYRSLTSKSKYSIILTCLCIYAFSTTLLLTTSDMLKTSVELSWRNPYYIDKLNYETNKAFITNRQWDYSKQTKGIDCVGVIDYNAGYASLLFKDNRILGLNEGYYTTYGKQELEKLKNKCNNIYTVSTISTLDRTKKYLDKNGYKMVDSDIREFKADFLNYYNDIILFEIKDKQEVNN